MTLVTNTLLLVVVITLAQKAHARIGYDRDLQSNSGQQLRDVLIKFKSSDAKNAISQSASQRVRVLLNSINVINVKLPQQAIDALSKRSDIGYIEDNAEYFLHDGYNYGIDKVQAYSSDIPAAVTTTTNCYSNSSFKVAVIDTGFDADHQDSVCQLDYKTSSSPNCIGMVSLMNTTGNETWDNPSDAAWHGSHTQGTISSPRNNLGYDSLIPDSSGICYMTGRVFDDTGGGAYTSYIVKAVEWAVNNGAKVINMSFGSTDYSQTFRDLIVRGRGMGVIFIASAGNTGGEDIRYPAAYPEVISVANTQEDNTINPTSTYGTTLDIAAPGTNILAMGANNKYYIATGTSMSAPHISGVTARIWSTCPNCPLSTVESCLFSTALDLNATGYDKFSGYGMIQASGAYECMKATPGCCTAAAPSVSITTPATPPPTKSPTKKPSSAPVKAQTRAPTRRPTKRPTRKPTKAPTKKPTRAPTRTPTKRPTKGPTKKPTKAPTKAPTKRPTKVPTKAPTKGPTKVPTQAPIRPPTRPPTKAPSSTGTSCLTSGNKCFNNNALCCSFRCVNNKCK